MSDIARLVLDTHVLIWYANGTNLSSEQVSLIENMSNEGSLYISAISVWEVAMLVDKGKIALPISLDAWIEKTISVMQLHLIDLSIPILISSCELPKYEHKDPADRLIIASTRQIDAHLMTFDQKIIDYAENGYLKITS